MGEESRLRKGPGIGGVQAGERTILGKGSGSRGGPDRGEGQVTEVSRQGRGPGIGGVQARERTERGPSSGGLHAVEQSRYGRRSRQGRDQSRERTQLGREQGRGESGIWPDPNRTSGLGSSPTGSKKGRSGSSLVTTTS